MSNEEIPRLWISVKDAKALITHARERWRMYATTREGWLVFLSLVVEAAVDSEVDIPTPFIVYGPGWASRNAGLKDLGLPLDREVAHLWADNALTYLEKNKAIPTKKPE